MALGSLNLRVSKADFENRISQIESKMSALQDVIQRYGEAKSNLDQFIEEGDSNYEAMCERIDANVNAAKKAWTSLQQTKVELERTVSQMEGMGEQIKKTIESATEATTSAVSTAIKVAPLL